MPRSGCGGVAAGAPSGHSIRSMNLGGRTRRLRLLIVTVFGMGALGLAYYFVYPVDGVLKVQSMSEVRAFAHSIPISGGFGAPTETESGTAILASGWVEIDSQPVSNAMDACRNELSLLRSAGWMIVASSSNGRRQLYSGTSWPQDQDLIAVRNYTAYLRGGVPSADIACGNTIPGVPGGLDIRVSSWKP